MKTNAIMNEIRRANRMYDILESRGMTQKDFARLMGKSETEVSRWLSGTHNLTLATLSKISVALGANIIGVMKEEEDMVAV